MLSPGCSQLAIANCSGHHTNKNFFTTYQDIRTGLFHREEVAPGSNNIQQPLLMPQNIIEILLKKTQENSDSALDASKHIQVRPETDLAALAEPHGNPVRSGFRRSQGTSPRRSVRCCPTSAAVAVGTLPRRARWCRWQCPSHPGLETKPRRLQCLPTAWETTGAPAWSAWSCGIVAEELKGCPFSH